MERKRATKGPLLAGVLLLTLTASAVADVGFRVQHGETKLRDGVYLLSADIQYKLGPKPSEALQNGVPLVFALEILVKEKPHWFWTEPVAKLRQRYSLKFHSLTERYLVTNLNSGDTDSFRSRQSALDYIGVVRDLPILDASLIDESAAYGVQIRATFDLDFLPAPLRLLAYVSDEWRLTSEWASWPL